MATEKGFRQDETSWPEAPGAGAMLRIPSFAKLGAPACHGGSMFQMRRTWGLVRGNWDPVKRGARSWEEKVPLGEGAYSPRDAWEAAQFVSDSESNSANCFWEIKSKA